jgi:uncharacterized protein YggU (UPF0235/DUF167 family)
MGSQGNTEGSFRNSNRFLKVRVFPGAKEEKIIKKSDDEFLIFVREKAKEGRANERVRKVLSEFLNLPEKDLILVRGGKQRKKIFQVKG